jgi:predicted CoA-binding protein
VNHDSYSDAYIGDILANCRTFAFVGASPTESRPSYFAMKYLMAKGYRVIPVNPAHAGKELLGQKIFASLSDIEEPVDVVDMFRTPDAAPGIAREAVAIGAKVMWMQLGVRRGGEDRRGCRPEGGDEPLREDRVWPPLRRDRLGRRQPPRNR